MPLSNRVSTYYHTVAAPTKKILDLIGLALEEKGFLLSGDHSDTTDG